MKAKTALVCVGIALTLSQRSIASQVTIGQNGINSAGLLGVNGMPLTGAGVGIGQVEFERPGDVDVGDSPSYRNSTINPAAVYERTQPNPPPAFPPADSNPIGFNSSHALWVAGVMISTHGSSTGVAPGALLYAAGYKPSGLNPDEEASITAQLIASQTPPTNSGKIHAINLSFAVPTEDELDGNQLLTQYVDWSAADDDVLYVMAGRDSTTSPGVAVPTDNFNGIVVASSAMVGGVYRQVSSDNGFDVQIVGSDQSRRTAIGLIAPGQDVEMRGLGDVVASNASDDGTSYAAPHVTGTVALLQQYATQKITGLGSTWHPLRSRRHEVMKAVLLNSADKIKDDGMTTVNGMLVPSGGFLGMERTVIDSGPDHDGLNGRNWLQSEAYGDEPFNDASAITLDDEMGAGHLNAKRALQQFSAGEFNSDATPVPVIGWDYGHTTGEGDYNKYAFNQSLLGGSFISITMAWDRVVNFELDQDSDGEYDNGDTFEDYIEFDPLADDVFNDLDVFLMPAGETDTDLAVARSFSNDSTIEHMFFQIPSTDEYEIWINQWDDEANNNGQDYAIAWWAKSAVNPASTGDYDGDGTVDAEDYISWTTNFGTSNTAADGNGDGIVNAADYTIWRDNLGAVIPGSGSLAAIPEPSSFLTLLAFVALAATLPLRTALLRRKK